MEKFYLEVKRIAKPNCILALISYGVTIMKGEIGERLSSFYWDDIHKCWPEGREHVETGYQTLNFPFKEESMSNISIERKWNRSDLIGYVDTWSAIRRAKSGQAHTLLEQFEREMAKIWPDDIKYQVTWPISACVTTIH